MLSRSFGRPLNPKNTFFSDLRAFAGFCGRLRAFCGRFFAGNSGRGKRNKEPIPQSHAHVGVLVVLVVLGDFTKNTVIFRKAS